MNSQSRGDEHGIQLTPWQKLFPGKTSTKRLQASDFFMNTPPMPVQCTRRTACVIIFNCVTGAGPHGRAGVRKIFWTERN